MSAPGIELKPPKKYKIIYAPDDAGYGFFWVESAQKLQEALSVRRNAPADFEAVYQGRPGQREGSIFLEADLAAFYNPGFSVNEFILGVASPNVSKFLQHGHMVLQAWDTAFSTSSQAAHSVCVTGLLVPCQEYHRGEDPALVGPCEYHFDVLILDVFRKRLDWGDLVNGVKRQYVLWMPTQVIIEKKASGQSLIQNFSATSIPILGVGAKDSKSDRALNSVTTKTAGSVQGWFRQHRVRTPIEAPWLEKWKAEMKDFSGAEDSSSDQVDATVHLVTQAIMLGATQAVLPTDWKPEYSAVSNVYSDAGAPDISRVQDSRLGILMALDQLSSLSEDPFQGMCARCTHEGDQAAGCKIMGRRMLPFDSCPSFIEKGLETDDMDASTGIESALRWSV